MSIDFKFIVNSPKVIGITFYNSLSQVFRPAIFGGSLGGKNPCVMEGSGESERFMTKTLELESQWGNIWYGTVVLLQSVLHLVEFSFLTLSIFTEIP